MGKIGYDQTLVSPLLYKNYIHKLIYRFPPASDHMISSTNIREDGLGINLIYFAYNLPDPNQFAFIKVKIDGENYWFIKINYLLETIKKDLIETNNGTSFPLRMYY